MSKPSPSVPNLRQWPPLTCIAFYILMLLVYIPFVVSLVAYFLLGPGILEQPIEIAISFQSIILFISMVVPLVTSIVCGYRSNSIQVSNGQEKEQWAVGLKSAFGTFAQKARFPFELKHPVHTEGFARYLMMDFARYLANPYHTGARSLFSRRRHIFDIVSGLVLALCIAGMPFRNWFKHDGIPNKGGDTFMQGVGCALVVFWCYGFWEPMWKVGWALKMGGIARQIRRECIKNGSVKASEEDVEKSRVIVDPKERLEWWIRESWKACGDGRDISQSEHSQLEENREKLCK
jgi:hypothetical protein